jgi:hypothetical protein
MSIKDAISDAVRQWYDTADTAAEIAPAGVTRAGFPARPPQTAAARKTRPRATVESPRGDMDHCHIAWRWSRQRLRI